jgi:hypothetical protein
MAVDPTSILTREEMRQARTPDELAQWVERKCEEFGGPAARWAGRFREGLAKQFYEEIRPLSFLATKLYHGRSSILCVPNLDHPSKDFDAVIYDGSVTPPAEVVKVEVTLAIDWREENLRMEYFREHGSVNPLGKVCHTGTKRTGHKIHIEEDAVCHAELMEKRCSLIRKAAERKSTSRRYGKTHVLIIFFDDAIWYDPQRDIAALEDFVKCHVLPLPLNFRTVYVLGSSRGTFLPYELTKA